MSEGPEEKRTVTVDADDLATLLFANGAMKVIEGAIRSRAEDPWVQQTKDTLAAAHERLNAAWNTANRGDYHPDWDKEISGDARRIMVRIGPDEGGIAWTDMAALRELRVKGLIEVGSVMTAIYWGGSSKPWLEQTGIMRVRLTPRGLEKMNGFSSGTQPREDAPQPIMRHMKSTFDH